MSPAAQRKLTPILPVLALFVSASIVSWEHVRRARLSAELVRTEREYARLDAARPKEFRRDIHESEADHHAH
jgi:hypothetical protein